MTLNLTNNPFFPLASSQATCPSRNHNLKHFLSGQGKSPISAIVSDCLPYIMYKSPSLSNFHRSQLSPYRRALLVSIWPLNNLPTNSRDRLFLGRYRHFSSLQLCSRYRRYYFSSRRLGIFKPCGKRNSSLHKLLDCSSGFGST